MLDEQMKVLFITRKFLPDVGGMEIAATQLYKGLEKQCDVKLIKCNGSKSLLPFKASAAAAKSMWVAMQWKPDVILLQDVVMASLAPILRPFCRSVVTIAHGLDVTYDNPLYQKIINRSLCKCDTVVCISVATKDECMKRGLKREDNLPVITYAIEDNLYLEEDKGRLRKKLGRRLGVDCDGRPILLTVGRLVKRKGVAWFCENCLPEIVARHPDTLYIVAGEGEMKKEIERKIKEHDLAGSVLLIGYVSKEQLELVYNSADIFVMPNIPLKADMEGFGLVALEACSCKLPVVASDLEGIRDAMNGDDAGILLEPGNADAFVSVISSLLTDEEKRRNLGERAREVFVKEHSWEKTTMQYLELFQFLIKNN